MRVATARNAATRPLVTSSPSGVAGSRPHETDRMTQGLPRSSAPPFVQAGHRAPCRAVPGTGLAAAAGSVAASDHTIAVTALRPVGGGHTGDDAELLPLRRAPRSIEASRQRSNSVKRVAVEGPRVLDVDLGPSSRHSRQALLAVPPQASIASAQQAVLLGHRHPSRSPRTSSLTIRSETTGLSSPTIGDHPLASSTSPRQRDGGCDACASRLPDSSLATIQHTASEDRTTLQRFRSDCGGRFREVGHATAIAACNGASAADGRDDASPRTLASSQLAPTRPASPVPAGATHSDSVDEVSSFFVAPAGVFEREAAAIAVPSLVDSLAQEVAAREVELRVLRAEVEEKHSEAARLLDRCRESEFYLMEASGNVDTLSAKVETKAGNQQAVLEASARQIDAQVVALRRKLAQMEWELAEKDEEIPRLRSEVYDRSHELRQRDHELGHLKRCCDDQHNQLSQLATDADRLRRIQAMSEWREKVQAKVAQAQVDAALAKSSQQQVEESRRFDEEIQTCRAFIARMGEKCRKHIALLAQQRRRYDALQMEERLGMSANWLGREKAAELREVQMQERDSLQERIREESKRKTTQEPHAKAYDDHEGRTRAPQRELAALTACMREISRVLHAGPGNPDDAVDAAVAAFVHAARELGESLPAMLRVGPSDFLIGPDLVQCALLDGRLHVRLPDGRLVGISDYLRSRSRHVGGRDGNGLFSACRGSAFSGRSVSPTPTVPVDAAAVAASASPAPGRRDGSRHLVGRSSSQTLPFDGAAKPAAQASSTMAPPMSGAACWGMPALTAPVAIGGAF
eukprot:TRINITY_DN6690_c0_g1_i1.p1 TRINITY_DN6690_c0_g1~~TRINITY_DN6690_c0_g1_i1.p1  ORF type:complete len:804 (+),score=135.65 TRINITY_DN6690_c0_g1_i1:46-2457(+)